MAKLQGGWAWLADEVKSGAEQKNFTWARALDDGTQGSRWVRSPRYVSIRTKDIDNNSIIQACVRWAVRNLPEPPLFVEKWTSKGFEPDPTHVGSLILARPLGRVKNTKNKFSYRLMIAGVAMSLMLDGNAYLHKLRNASGQMIGLRYLSHMDVEPVSIRGVPSELDYYDVQIGNGVQKVDPNDIIHFMDGVDPRNQLKACSPLKSLMRLVLSDNEIAVYNWAILKRPHPSIMLSPKDGATVGEDDLNDLVKMIEEQTADEKSGGVMAMTAAMDVEKLTINPEDMALDKMAHLPEQRITAIFGIAAVVVGLGTGLEKANYSNWKEARRAATQDFLVPYWKLIESVMDEQYILEFTSAGLQTRFSTQAVQALQEDENDRAKRVQADFAGNIIDQAEARIARGYEADNTNRGVWAWMLRPVGMPPGSNPSADVAKAISREIRKDIEGGL